MAARYPPIDTTDLRCDVCGGFYGGYKLYMIESCRHTYCHQCLEMFKAKGIPCWKCSIQVDLEAFDSIQTPSEIFKENRRVLPQNSETMTPQELQSSFKIQLEELKKDFNSKRGFLALNLGVITDYLESLNANLDEIETMMTSVSKDSWETDITKYQTLSERYDVLRDRISLRYGIPVVFCNLPWFHLDSREEYLQSIYTKLKDKKEVYAAHRIDNQMAYAKFSLEFSLEGDKIMMHSFCYLDVPQDSVILAFEDFKQQFCKQKTMQTFFRIFCLAIPTMLTVFIDMNTSRNSSRFMKFCSGEFGLSFKTSPINPNTPSVGSSGPDRSMMESTDRLPCFLKIKNNCVRKNLPLDYYHDHLEEDALVLYKEDDAIVQLCPDETIGFFNVLVPQKKYKAIGKVSSPKDLYCCFLIDPLRKVKPDKLYDCGLSITVPKI